MTTARNFLFATAALTAMTAMTTLAACDPEQIDPASVGELEFRCNPLFSACGPIGNTPFTGSLSLSPLDTQGNLYQDIAVDSVALAGGSIILDDFWAFEGQLYGRKGTITYEGMDFVDAEFRLTAWGDPISLVISGVTPPPVGEPFWLYMFEWDDGPGGTEPVCIPGGDLRAIVHGDLTINPETGAVSARPDTVYIACLRGAAGEAAYAPLGYGFRPFEHGLAAFQGAMHFLRADYCGDGKTWTEYGEPITYIDKWNVGTTPLTGHTDAVWGLHGALCIGSSLRAGFTYADIQCAGPKPPECGGEFAAKTTYLTQGRIWSKIP